MAPDGEEGKLSEALTGVRGEGGGALGEYDAELAGGAPEEADQHGGPPRPEQLAGAGAGSGGHRVGGLVWGGSRLVESQAVDERLHVRAGALLPLHGGGIRDRRSCQGDGVSGGIASLVWPTARVCRPGTPQDGAVWCVRFYVFF